MLTKYFKTNKNPIIATNVIRLNQSDSEKSLSIVRVHNKHMKHFRRWMPVCIKNSDNGKWIIRHVIGSSATKGLTMKTLALDYDAVTDLGIKNNNSPSLSIKKANFWQMQIWMSITPDIYSRYGHYWGILGTILGIIGLVGMF